VFSGFPLYPASLSLSFNPSFVPFWRATINFPSTIEYLTASWCDPDVSGIVLSRNVRPNVITFCPRIGLRSEEHTSELQSRFDLVCRLLLEKKKTKYKKYTQIITISSTT